MKIRKILIFLALLLPIFLVIIGKYNNLNSNRPSFLIYFIYLILLGLLPPILWLYFWKKEDQNPEPFHEVLIVFLAGMNVVLLAAFLEDRFFKAHQYFNELLKYGPLYFRTTNIFAFAFIEEICKLLAAIITALRSKYFDEPVDAMIYMVTAAMGFAALENMFFIADSLQTSVNQTILVSAFRFINAILLHASTAILIGAGLTFSYFHHERRWKELGGAIILATLLHASYNFFIINSIDLVIGVPGQVIATVLVLFGAITGLLLFERARRIINI